MQPDKGKSMMSVHSFIAILSAEQNMHPSVSSFSFPPCQQQPAVLIMRLKWGPWPHPWAGKWSIPEHALVHNPGAPKSFDSRGRIHLVKPQFAKAKSLQCTCSTDLGACTGLFTPNTYPWNGTQGMDRRDHDHDVQSAQCKKKHLSFSVCLSPYFDSILQKCPFSSPKTYPFSACHVSMLTV